MAQIVAPFFAPDLDNAWSAAPGALAQMNGFAPLQSGAYGSTGTGSLFTLTGGGIDALSSKLFRQISGSVRYLVFRPGNIDEYDNVGTRTNRGTGYNAATAAWSAAAWGNQIIACNYLDATQSSTSGAFSGLGGGSPKARYVAASLDFVMLADVDDGGSNVYSDMVWWSAIRNPALWTPALSTQAGNVRLLDVPGPIKGITTFRDSSFLVWKENAFWIGEYTGVGPNQYIFSFRLISARVGCIAPKSICELDGKIYFLHSSGFYEFDGQSLRNVGVPVFQSFSSESGYITMPNGRGYLVAGTPANINTTQSVVDDVEGVAWFMATASTTFGGTTTAFAVMYGYNPRSGRWARYKVGTGTNGTAGPSMVSGTYADAQAFKSDSTGRFWMVWNGASSGGVQSIRYPIATTDSLASTYTTGVFGSVDGSDQIDKHYIRTLEGTTSDVAVAATVTGYTSENKLVTNGSVSGTYNAELDEIDFKISSRFKTIATTWTVGKLTILGGIGFNGKSGGKR